MHPGSSLPTCSCGTGQLTIWVSSRRFHQLSPLLQAALLLLAHCLGSLQYFQGSRSLP